MTVAASRGIDRRALLRGRLSAPVRPPYARPEPEFVETCLACTDCVDACPEGILAKGSGGLPELRFENGECTFCAGCLDACPSGALHPTRHRTWDWRATLDDSCLGARGIVCRSCGDVCPTSAIRFGATASVAPPSVERDACTGCGACVASCPATAISMQQVRSR